MVVNKWFTWDISQCVPAWVSVRKSGIVSALSPVLDGLGTKSCWQRASSWQLAKHQIWLRTVRWTPSSSQSHPRHGGGAIWSYQDSLPGVQTTATKGHQKAKPQSPNSEMPRLPPPTFMTFLWRRCAGTVPHTSARDFRLADVFVCSWESWSVPQRKCWYIDPISKTKQLGGRSWERRMAKTSTSAMACVQSSAGTVYSECGDVDGLIDGASLLTFLCRWVQYIMSIASVHTLTITGKRVDDPLYCITFYAQQWYPAIMHRVLSIAPHQASQTDCCGQNMCMTNEATIQ